MLALRVAELLLDVGNEALLLGLVAWFELMTASMARTWSSWLRFRFF